MEENGIKKTLIIHYSIMPENVKEVVQKYDGFGNGKTLLFPSEFGPYKERGWKDNLTKDEMNKYYEQQKAANFFSGSYEQFILDYGFQVEDWFIKRGIDVDVDEIMIAINW